VRFTLCFSDVYSPHQATSCTPALLQGNGACYVVLSE
jgi:hypothetical protein